MAGSSISQPTVCLYTPCCWQPKLKMYLPSPHGCQPPQTHRLYACRAHATRYDVCPSVCDAGGLRSHGAITSGNRHVRQMAGSVKVLATCWPKTTRIMVSCDSEFTAKNQWGVENMLNCAHFIGWRGVCDWVYVCVCLQIRTWNENRLELSTSILVQIHIQSTWRWQSLGMHWPVTLRSMSIMLVTGSPSTPIHRPYRCLTHYFNVTWLSKALLSWVCSWHFRPAQHATSMP